MISLKEKLFTIILKYLDLESCKVLIDMMRKELAVSPVPKLKVCNVMKYVDLIDKSHKDALAKEINKDTEFSNHEMYIHIIKKLNMESCKELIKQMSKYSCCPICSKKTFVYIANYVSLPKRPVFKELKKRKPVVTLPTVPESESEIDSSDCDSDTDSESPFRSKHSKEANIDTSIQESSSPTVVNPTPVRGVKSGVAQRSAAAGITAPNDAANDTRRSMNNIHRMNMLMSLAANASYRPRLGNLNLSTSNYGSISAGGHRFINVQRLTTHSGNHSGHQIISNPGNNFANQMNYQFAPNSSLNLRQQLAYNFGHQLANNFGQQFNFNFTQQGGSSFGPNFSQSYGQNFSQNFNHQSTSQNFGTQTSNGPEHHSTSHASVQTPTELFQFGGNLNSHIISASAHLGQNMSNIANNDDDNSTWYISIYEPDD